MNHMKWPIITSPSKWGSENGWKGTGSNLNGLFLQKVINNTYSPCTIVHVSNAQLYSSAKLLPWEKVWTPWERQGKCGTLSPLSLGKVITAGFFESHLHLQRFAYAMCPSLLLSCEPQCSRNIQRAVRGTGWQRAHPALLKFCTEWGSCRVRCSINLEHHICTRVTLHRHRFRENQVIESYNNRMVWAERDL